MNHRITRAVLAFAFGLGLAWYAYDRATDPAPREKRATEEVVVVQARTILEHTVAPDSDLQIVDPLQPNRRAGKTYIAPTQDGWAVSGHYRRDDTDPWHAWLINVDADMQLQSLSVRDSDPGLIKLSAADPKIDARP